MTKQTRGEMVKSIRKRYCKATRDEKGVILDELCATTGYHRKYAIWLLNKPQSEPGPRRKRGPTYSEASIRILRSIWKAAGYPWSVRLKGLLPLWLVKAREEYCSLTPQVEHELLRISPRQIDRRLQADRRALKRGLYGRTKPGSLLKHHIEVRTDNWDINEPGFAEIDLVAHCGTSASGEFVHSLNLTDIVTQGVETRAVMGKGETGVVQALDEMRDYLPFILRGIDSDNGSEFINYHLYDYCQTEHVQFTRGRPYKKNDNAHIEQKNWTHVRKILAWDRYDSPEALEAINDLYRNELRIMMNFFQPTVKLIEKRRIGSKVKRTYDEPQTPIDRLAAQYTRKPKAIRELLELRNSINPFELDRIIQKKIKRNRSGHLSQDFGGHGQ
jgi:hypothetical protein